MCNTQKISNLCKEKVDLTSNYITRKWTEVNDQFNST